MESRENTQDNRQQQQNEYRPRTQSYDEQVIPAIKNKQAGNEPDMQMDSGVSSEKPREVIKLSQEEIAFAEPLYSLFGEETVRSLFAKHWATKEKGLIECEKVLTSGMIKLSKDSYKAGVVIASRAISDKIQQVVQKGLSLLETTLSIHRNLLGVSLDQAVQTSLFKQIFQRLGDNNSRVSFRVEEILLSMADDKRFTAHAVLSQATRHALQSMQLAGKPKHAIGRMSLVHKILCRSPIDKEDPLFKTSLKFAIDGMQHQNSEVRVQAFHVIVECYKQVGKSIRSSIQGQLRSAQMDMLEKSFKEVDEQVITTPEPKQGPSSLDQKLSQPARDSSISNNSGERRKRSQRAAEQELDNQRAGDNI